jgi:hypothetical protein
VPPYKKFFGFEVFASRQARPKNLVTIIGGGPFFAAGLIILYTYGQNVFSIADQESFLLYSIGIGIDRALLLYYRL